ncbi:hypothetical protein [Roseomonas sp. WA12]
MKVFRDPHDILRRAADRLLARQLVLKLKGGSAKRRRPARPIVPRSYPDLPPVELEVVADGDLPTGALPSGWSALYEIGASAAEPPVYVGQTRRGLRARFSAHLTAARHRRGRNRQMEAWLRHRAERGEPVVIRVVGLYPAGKAIDDAERARIAVRRAELGAHLLNQGPGGESAPAGQLVSAEARERARIARQVLQRMPGYRLHQSRVSSLRRHAPAALEALLVAFATADLSVTTRAICGAHGVSETVLLGLLDGTANALIVNHELLAPARAAQARRQAVRLDEREGASNAVASVLLAYLAAPAGTALADIARERGLDPRRVQEVVRRRERGVPDDLARAVRARMDEDLRHRMRIRRHDEEASRPERQQLRWLLTAYARPGSCLTLQAIATQLGITQSAVSHVLAGRRGRPLPRQLLRACRARAKARHAGSRTGARL